MAASITSLMTLLKFNCRISKHVIRGVFPRLHSLNLANIHESRLAVTILNGIHCRALHVTPVHHGLEEFFDDKDTLGKEIVKCGRPWCMDELRIKSNSDLHKLWYILLKERNVLMTMEHEYREQCEVFPSPERIHKVEESMENILEVVKERNTAFNLLEKGETGLPGTSEDIDALGRPVIRHHREYPFPAHMNIINRRKALLGRWTIPYLRRWREKINNKRYAAYMRKLKHAQELKEAFPEADIEFPDEPIYMKDFEAREANSSFVKREGHGI